MEVEYSDRDCYRSRFTAYVKIANATSSEMAQASPKCTLLVSEIMDSQEVEIFRIVSLFLVAICAVTSAVQLYRHKSVLKQGFWTAPVQAFLRVLSYNIVLFVVLFDPNASYGIFPLVPQFFLFWAIYFLTANIAVFMVTQMFLTMLFEMNQYETGTKMLPFYSWALIAFLLTITFAFNIPTKSDIFKGLQLLFLAFESLVLMVCNLGFGIALFLKILKHSQETKTNFARTLRKIGLMLLVATIVLLISVITNTVDGITKLCSVDKPIAESLLSKQQIGSSFWTLMIVVTGTCYAINIVGYVSFAKKKEPDQRPGQTASRMRRESSRTNTGREAVVVALPTPQPG